MISFIKTVFASMLGFLLSIVAVCFFLVFLVASSLIFSSGNKDDIPKNAILEINLDDNISEMPKAEDPFSEITKSLGNGESSVSLREALQAIDLASNDPNIKGIYLTGGISGLGWSKAEDVRNALIKFKLDRKNKKFIYAYSEFYMQKAYYVASVADSVFLNKTGLFEFSGLSSEQIFLKGMFDKLGIEPKLIRAGKYKSAGEMFIKDHISEENKYQISVYIYSIYNHFIDELSKTRKIERSELNNICVEGLIRFPEDAVKYKMVDKLVYYDQVLASFRKEMGLGAKDKVNKISLEDYIANKRSSFNKLDKNKIAVIYAVGEINGGEADEEKIGSDGLSKAIREARLDDNIKAIVLRVNSPGGSAMASDIIWREVVLAAKSKPLIASYGDVAASGGYYIGAPAKRIFAQPNTITGSIGVFALLPNLTKFYEEKLGIHWDRVKTGKFSDLGNPNRPMSAEEEKILQTYVDTTYMQFKSRVATGRNMNISDVDSIAQGRVWTGIDAKSIGLVDEIGNLENAISYAAKEAKLTSYEITTLPTIKKDFFQKLKSPLMKVKEEYLKEELGNDYFIYQTIKEAKKRSGILMYFPMNEACK